MTALAGTMWLLAMLEVSEGSPHTFHPAQLYQQNPMTMQLPDCAGNFPLDGQGQVPCCDTINRAVPVPPSGAILDLLLGTGLKPHHRPMTFCDFLTCPFTVKIGASHMFHILCSPRPAGILLGPRGKNGETLYVWCITCALLIS